MRIAGILLMLATTAAGLVVAGPPAGRLAAQSPSLAGAIGCDARGQAIAFPLAPAGSDLPAGELLPGALPNAALNLGESRLTVACQALFQDPTGGQTGDPFALDAGQVTFSVSEPGMIVESGSQSFTVACGDPAVAGSCAGGVPPAQPNAAAPSATAAAALTVHVALRPGAPLPRPPVAAAIQISATFAPLSGAGAVSVEAAIDLAPPLYRLLLSADRTVIGNEPNQQATLTAELRHATPDQCSPVGDGFYLVCRALVADPGAEGAEPGTVTFTTDLGAFVNLEQAVAAPCGGTVGGVARVAPPPGAEHPFPESCTDVAARLSPFGRGGDATVTATFVGSVTGAAVRDQVRITVAPRPVTITLAAGCTPVRAPSGLPPAAPVSLLVESVSPSSAVYAVWRHDEQADLWQAGFLRDGDTPLDFSTLEPGDPVTICVDAPAKFPLG